MHGVTMRTSIGIENGLISETMAATGLSTKEAVVEKALRQLVRRHRQRQAIADMSGIGWDGDPGVLREGRDA